MGRVYLGIASELADVSLAAVAVNGICLHLGFNRVEASQVELCIAEALTNAIRHAYHGESGHTVSIAVSVDADQMQIDVCDAGTPMSSDHVSKLLHGAAAVDVEPIDKALIAEGGRGLQIIHDLMDKVAYFREGEVNRLQLTKRVPVTGREQGGDLLTRDQPRER
jgi:serine/threonine-protein kinase RsbW